jgi:hypothetical protein
MQLDVYKIESTLLYLLNKTLFLTHLQMTINFGRSQLSAINIANARSQDKII